MSEQRKEINTLNLGHYAGKGIYSLYGLIHKKVRSWGVPIALLLTYGSITALTKQLAPMIKPLYTCVGFTIVYLGGYLWSMLKSQEYYNIKFTQYGLCKSHRKMYFCSKFKDSNNNIVYRFKTTVPLSFLNSNIDIIEMVLNTNVIDIKQGYNKKLFNIITNKKGIVETDYKEMAKFGDSVGMKVFGAFTHLNIDIWDIKENATDFKDEIYFNCNEAKNKLDKLIPEIEHLTGIKNLKLSSDLKFDFKLFKNKNVGAVSFGDLLVNTPLGFNSNLIVGMEENSNLKILDIKKIYHSIVAGTTGFGKSNLSHVLISSMLKSDIDVSFFLLDPKKSELKRYRDINRVLYSGDHEEILNILRSLVAEMDRRNKLIENDKFVNNLETWNNKYTEKLGYMIVYIEEIADLMTSSNKEYREEFQDLITRLSQLGRSTGIRLFLSTQYPKKEVLPTLIKNNCINRFGFAVSNSIESNVIVDTGILTELKNIGELFFKHNGTFTKIKVPYLEDKDIVDLITYLEQRHNKKGQYPLGEKFVSIVSNGLNTGVEACHYSNETDTAAQIKEPIVMNDLIEVVTKEDLLKFYLDNCQNEVYSVNETVKLVTIGRTKLQELRKELINSGSLEVINGKTYINTKQRLKIIK